MVFEEGNPATGLIFLFEKTKYHNQRIAIQVNCLFKFLNFGRVDAMKFSKSTIALILCTLPCFSYAKSDTGFAVSADLGFNSHSFKIDAEEAGIGYDESGTATAPALGFSYKFMDNWSVQLQYADAGEADLFDAGGEGSFTLSSDTTQLNVFGAYTTARSVGNWGFGARLGLSRWDTTFNMTASDGTQSETAEVGSDSGTALIGGISAFYAINDNFDVVVSADWTANEAEIEAVTADMQYSRYAIGAVYHF